MASETTIAQANTIIQQAERCCKDIPCRTLRNLIADALDKSENDALQAANRRIADLETLCERLADNLLLANRAVFGHGPLPEDFKTPPASQTTLGRDSRIPPKDK